jgi:hypothetical protein
MPETVEVDPTRPTPINGDRMPSGPGMSPQQIIQLMLQQGFAGWGTEIVLTRPTQNGPEKYATTPAKLIAENTRAMNQLNHTITMLLDGAIPVTKVDEKTGEEYQDATTFTQAMVDLEMAIGESSDLAKRQMRKKR